MDGFFFVVIVVLKKYGLKHDVAQVVVAVVVSNHGLNQWIPNNVTKNLWNKKMIEKIYMQICAFKRRIHFKQATQLPIQTHSAQSVGCHFCLFWSFLWIVFHRQLPLSLSLSASHFAKCSSFWSFRCDNRLFFSSEILDRPLFILNGTAY